MRLTDTQSRIIFVFSFLLSGFLQFWRISTWSFWFDESYTSSLIATDPSQIISLTSVDVHPPLYYLTLFSWSKVFGTSDLALRSMSALFMLLSIAILAWLLKRLVEKRYAYLAASFAALAPFTIRYGQEARMYAMISAIVLSATYIFVVQIQRKRRERSWRLWIAYSVLMTIALYTHYFSILVLLAHFAYALFHDTRTKDGKTWLIRLKNRISLIDRRFLKSLLLIPVLYIPWIPTLIDQFSAVNDGFWIPDASAQSLISVFTTLTVFSEVFERGSLFWLGYMSLAIYAFLGYKIARKAEAEEKRALWFVFAGFLFPVVALFVLSLPSFTSSYFYFRYFAQFSLFFYAGILTFALYGIKYLKPIVGWGMLVFVLAINAVGTVRVLNGVDKDGVSINQTWTQLEGRYQEGDEIIAASMWQWFNARHYNSTPSPVKYLDTGYWYGSHAPIYEAKESILVNADLSDVSSQTGRVWMIEPKDFVTTTPDGWVQIGEEIQGEDTDFVLYRIGDSVE